MSSAFLLSPPFFVFSALFSHPSGYDFRLFTVYLSRMTLGMSPPDGQRISDTINAQPNEDADDEVTGSDKKRLPLRNEAAVHDYQYDHYPSTTTTL